MFASRIDELDEALGENLRLGQDLRFLLVCVGGGAAQIGREIVRRRMRYLETVVINSDSRVQHLDEFDRRVCLGATASGGTDTGGSPAVGGQLARAAEPALERIFEGATFVTVVASLGGGCGTGVLPFVLDAAARKAAVLSVFVVKPFRCEPERRALAERAIARLHFVDSWVEKLEQHHATITVLDNESLVPEAARLPMNHLNRHWADLVSTHVERAFVIPAEAAVQAHRIPTLAEAEPVRVPEPVAMPLPPTAPTPGPTPPLLPGILGAALPMEPGGGPSPFDAELTFEIIDTGPRGPELP